jgi:hypothetical protein
MCRISDSLLRRGMIRIVAILLGLKPDFFMGVCGVMQWLCAAVRGDTCLTPLLSSSYVGFLTQVINKAT